MRKLRRRSTRPARVIDADPMSDWWALYYPVLRLKPGRDDPICLRGPSFFIVEFTGLSAPRSEV